MFVASYAKTKRTRSHSLVPAVRTVSSSGQTNEKTCIASRSSVGQKLAYFNLGSLVHTSIHYRPQGIWHYLGSGCKPPPRKCVFLTAVPNLLVILYFLGFNSKTIWKFLAVTLTHRRHRKIEASGDVSRDALLKLVDFSKHTKNITISLYMRILTARRHLVGKNLYTKYQMLNTMTTPCH